LVSSHLGDFEVHTENIVDVASLTLHGGWLFDLRRSIASLCEGFAFPSLRELLMLLNMFSSLGN
jgi:hypothetical protein